MFDYQKFTKDLAEAEKISKDAMTGDDGGTANLDCMTIRLPRLPEKKVIAAVKEAGLYTAGKRNHLGMRYFISPPCGAQGNDRCRQVEAMYKSMKDKGYDVLNFYMSD